MKYLNRTHIANIQEMPTRRGIYWTADLYTDDNLVAHITCAGNGGALQYTAAQGFWRELYPTLETEAQSLTGRKIEALDLLCCCAHELQPLDSVNLPPLPAPFAKDTGK